MLLLLALGPKLAIAQSNSHYGNTGSSPNRFRQESNLKVTVTDLQGNPLGGVPVHLRDSKGATVAVITTAKDGSAQFSSVITGAYEVTSSRGTASAQARVDLYGPYELVTLRLVEHGTEEEQSHTVSVNSIKVPKEARKEMQRAQDYLRKQDLRQARIHLDRALVVYPQYAEALATRGAISSDERSTEAAVADLQKALEFDPKLGWAYVALTCAYNNAGMFREAKRIQQHELMTNTGNWNAYYEAARTDLALADLEGASLLIEKAEALGAPQSAPLHLMKAFIFLRRADYTSARSELALYVAADPSGNRDFVQRMEAELRQTIDRPPAHVGE